MKQSALFIVFLLMGPLAQASSPKMLDDYIFVTENQMLGQRVDASMAYKVDPVAQLCFATIVMQGGLTQISCESLAKRPEWTPYITWVR